MNRIALLQDLKECIKRASYPPKYESDHDFYEYGNETNFGFGIEKKLFNCYAYAMQFDVDLYKSKYYENKRENCIKYNPGFLSNNIPLIYTIDSLIEAVYYDLEILGINMSCCDLASPISNDSYKIAIMIESNKINKDFHFIRQNYDGSWSEKQGYGGSVNIVNPKEQNKNYVLIHTIKIKRSNT